MKTNKWSCCDTVPRKVTRKSKAFGLRRIFQMPPSRQDKRSTMRILRKVTEVVGHTLVVLGTGGPQMGALPETEEETHQELLKTGRGRVSSCTGGHVSLLKIRVPYLQGS